VLRYVFSRVGSGIATIFLIVTLAFFLIRLAPGGPFDEDRELPPEVAAQLLAAYHLDEPMHLQYLRYLSQLLRGDLGPSFKYRDQSVNDIIAEGLPVSMRIGGWALLFAAVLGVAIGSLSAARQNSAVDHTLSAVAVLGLIVPTFVLAPLLVLLFAVHLQWLPAAGWVDGEPRYMVLPVVALVLPQVAVISRLARASMLDTLGTEFIRTARAKGLPERLVILRHALKGALLPVVTYLGPTTAGILTGSVVVEQIFNIPGIGRFFVLGALNRDYTLVMGMVVLFGTLLVIANLIVDLIYGALDPRIRYG
jgi:oligopeptide transport system permease protein